jgi:hypothetical protein
MSIDHELKKIPVTKLDAARRQLETAITLWFHEFDPVSVHTLTCAAYQLLYDINIKTGGPPMMPDSPHIRPERINEWRQILRSAQNFFKHADQDPKGTFFFAPQATQAILLEACERYQMQSHEDRPLMRLFVFWLGVHEPRFFLPHFQQQLRDCLPINRMTQLGKRQFFYELLPAMSSILKA